MTDDELWAVYKESGAVEIRDELITRYFPLVRAVASKMAASLPPAVDKADLVSYGVFGLIDAVAKFDPSRHTKFEMYARLRIKGSILDELRLQDWVPRPIRDRARLIRRTTAELESELGRSPSVDELAGRLGGTVETLEVVLSQSASASAEVLPLHEIMDGDDESFADYFVDHEVEEGPGLEDEVKAMLATAISGLRDRERMILLLYYREGLNLSQIGDIFGVSGDRINQLHMKAMTQVACSARSAARTG